MGFTLFPRGWERGIGKEQDKPANSHGSALQTLSRLQSSLR